ncbi:hypothetical protein [Micromonospora echinofusca]|uniref:Transcription factor WhiB n=1 Tax=Micromonospora echinofusca TaxID=47858 RepID=A0ABS3VJ70_MICEH|nr:hypothetical protein [Micromonospora echinofusca]MBO4204572.1 hypothetical protein [Micromonospora echinofusca]
MTDERDRYPDDGLDRGELVPPELLAGTETVWRCPTDGCTTAERGSARRPAGTGICARHRVALRRVDA